MRLREWKYINTPTTASASASSNTGFKKRLERLIKYHGDNLPVDVDYLMVGLLTKDKLEFAEQYDDGHVEEYKISIDPSTESWKVEIFINRQPDENFSGTGWPELLKSLRPCIVVPETRELEYKNLLTEWVAMNNKPSSSGYKKRFEKLFKYHIDHASSELERVNNKVINDYDFHLSEHYNTGSDEFNRTIIVSVNKYTDEFFLSIFIDGKDVYHNVYKSYEECIQALAEDYMFLPDSGTPGYDDLLTEAIENSVKIPNKLYHATYKQFLKSIQQKGLGNTKRKMWSDSKRGVVYLADDPDVAESYAETAEWPEDREDPDYYYENIIILEIDTAKLDTNKLFIDENVLLDEGEENSTWEYHDIIPWEACRIFDSSFAEDFKLYENLWEDVDIEEYNIILGKTSYNLYNNYELESYLTQSAKLMRKPLNTEKPLEFFKLQKVNKMLRTPKYYENKKLAAKLQKVKSELEKNLTNYF